MKPAVTSVEPQLQNTMDRFTTLKGGSLQVLKHQPKTRYPFCKDWNERIPTGEKVAAVPQF